MMGGDEYDLVFDAPWCHLKEMAADEYYADLSEYFNNDEYPGLKAAFSPEVMENNKWYGQMCYIPLMRTYGNGIPAVHYRKDWAKEWGIGTDGQINSMEELTAYWDKAKEHDILEVLVRNANHIVTIDALCEAVWGDNPFGYGNSLLAHIRRIREKIEITPSKPKSLITVKGLGYKINVESRL